MVCYLNLASSNSFFTLLRLDNGFPIVTRLKARLMHHKLLHASHNFSSESAAMAERYHGLKVSNSMEPKRLEKYKNVHTQRMRDKALHFEYLRDKDEGMMEVKGPVNMLSEILREQAEIRRKFNEANIEANNIGGVEWREGGEEDEWEPVGPAAEVISQIEKSKRLREDIGWGGDLDIVDHEIEDEDFKVPLDYMESHYRLLAETEELRRSVEATLRRT